MEKMPVKYFGFYSLLDPYINGYYQVGEREKARELWGKVAKKYQENLQYYSTLSLERQYQYLDEIITNVESYRGLIDILVRNQDEKLINEKIKEFNQYLDKFSHFYGEEEDVEYSPDSPSQNDSGLNLELDSGNRSIDGLNLLNQKTDTFPRKN
ncbi:MAG TPA: hypothetical protein VFM82_07905, partial [Flavobacteriaceae bacterium]|nr:hypothetical protein [Flavobacteriaceae bacterium]